MQFLSDLVHVFEGFKAGGCEERSNKLEAELVVANEDKKKLEGRVVDMERQAAEIAKTNSSFITHVCILIIIVVHG